MGIIFRVSFGTDGSEKEISKGLELFTGPVSGSDDSFGEWK